MSFRVLSFSEYGSTAFLSQDGKSFFDHDAKVFVTVFPYDKLKETNWNAVYGSMTQGDFFGGSDVVQEDISQVKDYIYNRLVELGKNPSAKKWGK